MLILPALANYAECVSATLLQISAFGSKEERPMPLYLPERFYKATVPLSLIYRHPDLQVRAVARFGELQILPDIVETYKKLYEQGKDLGPLAVVREIKEDGTPTGRFLLADGNHRFAALKQLNRTEVLCRVYKGDDFTAVLLAARENGRRGLQFGSYDTKEAISVLLLALADQGTTWSNQELADRVGTDGATVRAVRAELKKWYAIPDGVDDHKFLLPEERPRWNRNQGYIADQLFDDLPGADQYVPPPAPRHQGRAKSGSGKRRK
jgi:hypothetical protein